MEHINDTCSVSSSLAHHGPAQQTPGSKHVSGSTYLLYFTSQQGVIRNTVEVLKVQYQKNGLFDDKGQREGVYKK